AEAIVAIHAAAGATGTPRPVYEAVDPARAAGILFGPPRALSGHASKAALGAYGVPTPAEELCASASRAAAEASRMGFPVRITLASPDLRLLEHPDLIVDGLDHATQVRDVFRQLVATAEARVAGARILGVTVSAATVPRATLRARLTPLTHGRVLVDIGFADPHGLASGDHTQTVFPTSVARFERVLGRLAGADLLVDGPAAVRRQTIDAIAQAVLRSSAFVADHADAITAVELDPLVVLADGSAEVRDACIEVSDAFERRLDREAGTGASTANG
ncbi:MAG: acetate--CoA ligase family protein, partial [Myxococcales bacterium]|nr:acetate--CoA ligase family protein [Myxococcales bacterium]